MRKVLVSLAILAVFSTEALAECSPFARKGGDYSTCTTGQRLAWIVAIPVWIPLAFTYKLIGGEFSYERAEREERERQTATAWQRMTPEERQEAIQLMQLQQQQQQHNTEMLLRAWELSRPRQPQTTTCNPNIFGGFDCTQQ